MATDRVVALRTSADFAAGYDIYKKHLAEMILHILNDRGRSLAEKAAFNLQYDRLSDMDGYVVLGLVWKESNHVTDEDLQSAGVPRKFVGGVTRTALGNALRATDRRPVLFSSAQKFTRRAARIVTAAMVFELIEQQVCRANLKPLRATAKLDELMVKVGSEAAILLHAPCAGFGCRSSPSDNGAAGA